MHNQKINKCNYQGFSLIGILIALVIVGILASIAYPSYQQFIHKSRRAEALTTLIQYQIIMERCFSQNFSYLTTCAAMPAFPQTTPLGFYSINVSNRTAKTYTLTAITLGSQAYDTQCVSLSINQTNVKTAVNSSAVSQPECWNA